MTVDGITSVRDFYRSTMFSIIEDSQCGRAAMRHSDPPSDEDMDDWVRDLDNVRLRWHRIV